MTRSHPTKRATSSAAPAWRVPPPRRSTAPTPPCWSPNGPSSASSTGRTPWAACASRSWWMAATSSTATCSRTPASPTRASAGRAGRRGWMQALVLAGGEGTRLRPLTLTLPKPVIPLAGRPFLSFMLDWLGRHGVDDALLSCGYRSPDVEPALGNDHRGMRLRYVIEDEPLGTAGPLRLAADSGVLDDERVLVLNGDTLTDLDLTQEIA